MEPAIQYYQIILIAGLLVVVVTRRFSPFIGGLLGCLAALGVGIWGFVVFADAGQVSFAGLPLSRGTFLLLVGGWLAFEIFGVTRAFRVRQARRAEREEEERAESSGEPPPGDGPGPA